MAVYYRYKKLQKCIKYPNGTIIPVVPNEFKRGDLISMDSYEDLDDCQSDYLYRWHRLEVTEDSDSYICEGYSQYYKEVYQQSIDGEHWTDVVPRQERKGELFNEYSETCGYVPLIKWEKKDLNLSDKNTYICDNDDLYEKLVELISYDNGKTYVPTGKSKKGELLMENSPICRQSAIGTIYSIDNDMKITINFYTDFDNYIEFNSGREFNVEEWSKNNPDVVIGDIKVTDAFNGQHPTIGFNNFVPLYRLSFQYINSFINFYDIDTSLMTDMSRLFGEQTLVTDNDLININTSNVISMEGMFYGCAASQLNLTNFDTSKVTNMSYMFGLCGQLTSIDLSSFDTSKVTNMSEMFRGASNLETIDLSSFDTSKVTNMSFMFAYIGSYMRLKTLLLDNFDISNVVNMKNMFIGCYNINYIRCKQAFKDWCIANQDTIKLPDKMREGGSGTWEIVG